MVLLLLINCLLLLWLCVGPEFGVWSYFCYAVLDVLSSFAIISLRKSELVASVVAINRNNRLISK